MVRSRYSRDQEAGSCRSLGGMRHRPVAEPENRQSLESIEEEELMCLGDQLRQPDKGRGTPRLLAEAVEWMMDQPRQAVQEEAAMGKLSTSV